MITHHIRCRASEIEKNVDLIMQQCPFAPFLVTVDTFFERYWEDNRRERLYGVLLYLNDEKWIYGVKDSPIDFGTITNRLLRTSKPKEKLVSIFEESKIPYVESLRPYQLKPIDIKKPWGKEIWYTGIERRGISTIKTPTGEIPLYYLNVFLPRRIKGFSFDEEFILLKTLKTHRSALGSLYIELHEQKEEVYVISHVDPHIYPGGKAKILYGFNSREASRLGGEAAYRRVLQEKVNAYRLLRDEVDEALEKALKESLSKKGETSLTGIMEEEAMLRLLEKIDPALREREKIAYEKLRGYFGHVEVEEGNVLRVETGVPHGLCHGVDVVEFQSPHYERKIIAFNQRVLTQKRWDVNEAFSLMRAGTKEALNHTVLLYEDENYREEEVGRFENFVVVRTSLKPQHIHTFIGSDTYQIIFSLDDNLEVETNNATFTLMKEDALLIPTNMHLNFYFNGNDWGRYLVTYPSS